MGWYAGNPSAWKGDVEFRTGGIDVHLHSFAAATIRNDKGHWVAPLLKWGATCTLGTTWEPYTTGFPYEWIYWDRIARGFNWAEATAMSNHLLSWQATFFGDPLYTPYPNGFKETHAANRAAFKSLMTNFTQTPTSWPFPTAQAAFEIVAGRLKKALAAAEAKNGAEAAANLSSIKKLVDGMGFDETLAKVTAQVEASFASSIEPLRKRADKDPREVVADIEGLLAATAGMAINAKVAELNAEVAREL
jgi:hypothetical protein